MRRLRINIKLFTFAKMPQVLTLLFNLSFQQQPKANQYNSCHTILLYLQNGFHGDLNETFLVGNVDETGRKLVEASYESLRRAIEQGLSYNYKVNTFLKLLLFQICLS